MRKRYQKGSVTKSGDGRYWVGKYRQGGKHKTKLLGNCKGPEKITKSEAREKLADILKPINARVDVSPDCTVKEFVENVYFTIYQKKWEGFNIGDEQGPGQQGNRRDVRR